MGIALGGKDFAQIVHRIRKGGKDYQFSFRFFLQFLAKHFLKRFQFRVETDFILLAEPFFLNGFQYGDIRLDIFYKRRLDVFHVYFEETTFGVLFKRFFNLFHAVIRRFIKICHIGQVSFFEYRNLVCFLYPSQYILVGTNHEVKGALESRNRTFKPLDKQFAHETRNVDLPSY